MFIILLHYFMFISYVCHFHLPWTFLWCCLLLMMVIAVYLPFFITFVVDISLIFYIYIDYCFSYQKIELMIFIYMYMKNKWQELYNVFLSSNSLFEQLLVWVEFHGVLTTFFSLALRKNIMKLHICTKLH